jgi:hypothetical protein
MVPYINVQHAIFTMPLAGADFEDFSPKIYHPPQVQVSTIIRAKKHCLQLQSFFLANCNVLLHRFAHRDEITTCFTLASP